MTWSRATATAGSAAVTVACYRLRIVCGHCEPWRVASDLPVFAGQLGPPKKAHFCDRHHIANATMALGCNGGTLSATDVDSSAAFVAQANVAGSNGFGKFSIG